MEPIRDDEEDPWEKELSRKVANSEMRMEKALLHLRVRRTRELMLLRGLHGGLPGSSKGAQNFQGMTGNVGDEVRITRGTEELLETYRRLTRPDKVGRLWSLPRWALVAATLSKLRCLASVAYWDLPTPATNTSRDPKALADTGMSDMMSAAAHVDSMEGEIDARILRVASRLVSTDRFASKAAVSRLPKLSPEVWAMFRLTLLNLRNCAARIELLFNEKESRPAVLDGIHHTYGAMAASLACLRQRLGDEIGEKLRDLQDPLRTAAQAACSLGVGGGARLGSRPVKAKGPGKTGKGGGMASPGRARGDPFLPLHQATLLINIASLTEVRTPRSIDAPAGEVTLDRLMQGATEDAAEKSFTADDANWNIEFTAAQLCRMQQATKDEEPKVRGAQQLLADTLDCYTTVADAMSCAYSDEAALRANPGALTSHTSLLSLVRDLQGLWKDAGAVLAPSRIKDLMALETVRLRHEGLVIRALEKGGIDFATVVLARLALVDEMLQEPSERLITGELDFELMKPYQLVESTVRSLTNTADEQRRRRWLRCPHAAMHSVLAGEVWRQLLRRFVTVESAFEPLRPCEDVGLSFRDFRIVLCLLEISVSERVAQMLFEAAADAAGCSEATLKGLLEIIHRYGPTTSGDRGTAASVLAAASRAMANGMKPPYATAQPRAQTPQTGMDAGLHASGKRGSMNPSMMGRRGSSKRASPSPAAPQDAEQDSLQLLPALETMPKGAPMVCQRCLDGDVPVMPYASAQELNRTCCARAAEGAAAASPNGDKKHQGKPGDGTDEDNDVSEDQQRFGEDAIVSWSTAVLTQNILLTKDERGIYFKWLARIVLRTGTDEDLAKSKGVGESEPTSQRNRSKAARRTSFNAEPAGSPAEQELQPGKDNAHARKSRHSVLEVDVSAVTRKKSISALIGGHLDAGSKAVCAPPVDSEDEESQPSPKVVANTKALNNADWETKEFEEAVREVSQALPDQVLSVFRIDVGLAAEKDRPSSEQTDYHHSRSSVHARQQLFSDFTDHISKGGPSMAQRAKRTGRVAKVITGLRHLNVQESEIVHLERELKIVAENSQPHANGILLVAGAARAAQSILAKAQKSPRDDDEKKNTGDGASSKFASKLGINPEKQALQVIESSGSHTRGCYDRCGYEDSSHTVAAALRYLEHDLFQGTRVRSDRDAQPGKETAAPIVGSNDQASSAQNTADEETVANLVPVLLPRQTADRLLAQAQREWEEEEAARIAAKDEEAQRAAEAKAGYSPSNAKSRKVSDLQLQPIVRVKSIGTQDSGSGSSSAGEEEPRPASPVSYTTRSGGSSGSPRSRPRSQRDSQSRGSRRGSRDDKTHSPASRTSVSHQSEEARPGSSNGGSFPAIPTPPGQAKVVLGGAEVLTWRENLNDWPCEVLQLFDSVQVGCHRIRSAKSFSGTWQAQRRNKLADKRQAIAMMNPHNLVTKSRSETEMLLPKVLRPSSTTKNETRYKKANAASKCVMGKWGKPANVGPPQRSLQFSESQTGELFTDGSQGPGDVRRCGSSPALLFETLYG